MPLEKDVVTLAVIQTGINSLQDFENPKVGLEENLDHMIEMGEKACAQNPKPDFLLFHEFPLTGYSSGSRTEKLKYTIQVPGPETEELGKLSKRCDAYLIFGSYATDADWPAYSQYQCSSWERWLSQESLLEIKKHQKNLSRQRDPDNNDRGCER